MSDEDQKTVVPKAFLPVGSYLFTKAQYAWRKRSLPFCTDLRGCVLTQHESFDVVSITIHVFLTFQFY